MTVLRPTVKGQNVGSLVFLSASHIFWIEHWGDLQNGTAKRHGEEKKRKKKAPREAYYPGTKGQEEMHKGTENHYLPNSCQTLMDQYPHLRFLPGPMRS